MENKKTTRDSNSAALDGIFSPSCEALITINFWGNKHEEKLYQKEGKMFGLRRFFRICVEMRENFICVRAIENQGDN
jgi:hypothetical protein